jgi:ABC-type nitrate/sulfonate/bicarbonate transport system ATPase subunit
MASGAVSCLEQVSVSIAPGEFISVVGASGCGKSTEHQKRRAP